MACFEFGCGFKRLELTHKNKFLAFSSYQDDKDNIQVKTQPDGVKLSKKCNFAQNRAE